MTSRSLFFKLMKEDFKARLWAFTISCLGFFFSVIVATAMMISIYGRRTYTALDYRERISTIVDSFKGYIGTGNPLFAFGFLVLALIMAMSGFAYLYSKKKVDLFHSLPVKREMLYFVKTVNGILIVLVPYIVSVVTASVLMVVNTSDIGFLSEVFISILGWVLLFLLNYMVAMLAIMLTGNMLIGMLGYAFFCFYFPILGYIITEYRSTFFNTYYGPGFFVEKVLPNTSSLVLIFDASLSTATRAIISILVSAVLLVINLVIYKKRASEAAGKSMAFNIIKLPIKFMTVILISIFMFIVTYEIMDLNFFWGTFGGIVSGVIAHCLMEIIYNQDFKKIFAKKLEMGVAIAIAFIFIGIFAFDILGYDRYLPKEGDIKSVAMVTRYLEANNSQYYYKMRPWKNGSYADNIYDIEYVDDKTLEKKVFDRMNITNKKAVLELAKIGIDGGRSDESNSGNLEEVIISYKLNSGLKAQRCYYIDENILIEKLGAIYDDEGFKNSSYPILSDTGEDIVSVDYNGIGNDNKHIDLSDAAMKSKLLETYKKELSEFKYETRLKSHPFASIRFNDEKMQQTIESYLKDRYDAYIYDGGSSSYVNAMDEVGYYPIYPEFSETVKLLKSLGANVYEKMTIDNISDITSGEGIDRIEISYYVLDPLSKAKSYEQTGITYSEDKDIAQILDKLIFNDTPYKDYLNEETDIDIAIYLKDDTDMPSFEYSGDRIGYSSAFYFKKGDLPDIVKNDMKD